MVAEALTGLIYHRPSDENSKFLPSWCLIISSNIRLLHYTTGHHGLCQIKQRWNETSFPEQSVCKAKVLSSGAVCRECDQRRNKFACKAKLHVLDDQVIKQVNDITHVASRTVVESSKVRQEMKKRARETEETHNRSSLSPSHFSVSKRQ